MYDLTSRVILLNNCLRIILIYTVLLTGYGVFVAVLILVSLRFIPVLNGVKSGGCVALPASESAKLDSKYSAPPMQSVDVKYFGHPQCPFPGY